MRCLLCCQNCLSPRRLHAQGTFLPAAKAADLGSMGRHVELLEAARDIRQGIADLKSRNETPEGLTHRRSLERRHSISQAERHMFDFDRIIRVRRRAVHAEPIPCSLVTTPSQASHIQTFQEH